MSMTQRAGGGQAAGSRGGGGVRVVAPRAWRLREWARLAGTPVSTAHDMAQQGTLRGAYKHPGGSRWYVRKADWPEYDDASLSQQEARADDLTCAVLAAWLDGEAQRHRAAAEECARAAADLRGATDFDTYDARLSAVDGRRAG